MFRGTQLERLRSTIDRQAQAAADGEAAKQELETRLKQLFLRGVAAMNLEAVSIFNEEHAHSHSQSSQNSQNPHAQNSSSSLSSPQPSTGPPAAGRR